MEIEGFDPPARRRRGLRPDRRRCAAEVEFADAEADCASSLRQPRNGWSEPDRVASARRKGLTPSPARSPGPRRRSSFPRSISTGWSPGAAERPDRNRRRPEVPTPELETPMSSRAPISSGCWSASGRAARVNQVGVEDSFFDLGGHSLIAVRLFVMIKEGLSRRLPISILFEAPTIVKMRPDRRAGRARDRPSRARSPRRSRLDASTYLVATAARAGRRPVLPGS